MCESISGEIIEDGEMVMSKIIPYWFKFEITPTHLLTILPM